MAIYNGRILMRKGNEADFDASKLMSGEWAVSLDAGIVRICLEAGKVIRMATYEAFEEDMKQVEAILLECQTIEEAVQRINTEINAKVDAVVEYVGQAKTYRDEAKTFRDEAEAFKNQAGEIAGIDIATTEKAGIVKPDGETLEVDADGTMRVIGGGGVSDYSELENKPSINGTELNGNKTLNDLGIASATELEKTNTKLDTIIEKADLGIKETASGEEIHLTDSAEGKAVEFALYGKATQDGEPTPENPQEIEVSGESYNLIPYPYVDTTKEVNGITFTDNGDGTIAVNGTVTATTDFNFYRDTTLKKGKYIFSKGNNDTVAVLNVNRYKDGVYHSTILANGNTEAQFELTEDDVTNYTIRIYIRYSANKVVENLVFKPMIRKASVKNDRYMPYGKGSVEVKSVGKNLLPYPYLQGTNTHNGITFTDNGDGSVTINGTATANAFFNFIHSNSKSNIGLKHGDKIKVTCKNMRASGMLMAVILRDSNDTNLSITNVFDGEYTIEIPKEYSHIYSYIYVANGTKVENLTVYPMIRYADITDDTWQPYKETISTIPTENGLAGIKVSSGGNYTDQNGQQWICDEVVKYADGSGAYIQRVKSFTLNGSETWSVNADYNVFWTNSIMQDAKLSVNHVVCDSYIFDSKSISAMADKTIKQGIDTTGTKIYCYIRDTAFSTASELNTFLASNNVKGYYILKEPITTPLKAEELAEISTFYPITNISNDFDCGMKIEYVGDRIITTNTEIPIVEPKDEEELQDGDNIVTLFGKIKKKLKNVGKGVVDVVDNLLSTSTTLPLSANQGRVLDEKIGTINESLEEIGTIFNGAWISSTSGNGEKHTETIYLPKGTYIINYTFPVSSASIVSFLSVSDIQYPMSNFMGGSYATKIVFVEIANDNTPVYVSDGGAASTLSYIERAGISAIKIK